MRHGTAVKAAARLATLTAMVVSGAVLAAQVPYARLVDAAKEPGAWLTYSGGVQRAALLDPGADHGSQRGHAEARVGLPGGRTRPDGNLGHRRRRPDVRHRAAHHGDRARSEERPAGVELRAADAVESAPDWLSRHQPRRRHPRRHGLRGLARRRADCARRPDRGGAVGDEGGRQRHRALDHHGAAGGERQGDRGHQRRGSGHPRLRRRLRREDRQARVAHAHGAGRR